MLHAVEKAGTMPDATNTPTATSTPIATATTATTATSMPTATATARPGATATATAVATATPVGGIVIVAPVIGSVSSVTVASGNNCNGATTSSRTAPAVLNYGVQLLTLSVDVTGNFGGLYQLDVLKDGVLQDLLSETGLIIDDPQTLSVPITFANNAGACTALVRGVYELRVHLDSDLIQVGTATIR